MKSVLAFGIVGRTHQVAILVCVETNGTVTFSFLVRRRLLVNVPVNISKLNVTLLAGVVDCCWRIDAIVLVLTFHRCGVVH